MATLNYAFKELSCKIVYYGCGLCGKTTNLIYIHKTVPQKFRGELVSLATEQDRTLFFDFLPLDLGEVKGFKTKFQLYTVPGQVYYNATRKLVLRGVDGIVFVVDSQKDRLQENIDSLENLKQNLAEYGLHLQVGADDHDGIPWVLQYNKRDMPQVATIEELEVGINPGKVPFCESVAFNGQGVKETLKRISSLVIKKLNAETPGTTASATAAPAPAGPAKAAPAPAPAPASSDYSEMSQEEIEDMEDSSSAAAPDKPKLPDPKPKSSAKQAALRPGSAQAAPPPAPAAPQPAPSGASSPQINAVKENKALWRGMGLGSANLTFANLVGGEADQYQITGKVTFLGIFGGTWSRKVRYRGRETKNDAGSAASFFKFTSDDGQKPDLDVWVRDDFDKALYISYLGTGGQVEIVPPGKQPLT